MEDLSSRNYAHIGDAVWELFVREYTVFYYNTSTERRCNHFIPGLFVSVICLLFEKIKCFFVLKTRDQVIF